MVTHAFFKACLFLSAGSVIHGCHHEQDMRKMGGLRKKMPLTFIAMLICTLAIAGMPLFSGFYSKDRIIQSAIESTMTQFRGANAFAIFALAAAACLTTFYMFRLIFMTFYGEPQDQHVHEHAHESPKPMTISLLVLAALGLFGGHFWLTQPGDALASHGTWFTNMVSAKTLYPGIDLDAMNQIAVGEHAHHAAHNWALIVSLSVLALGLFGAVWIYLLKKADPAKITARLGEVYTTVLNKYYIDEFVNVVVIKFSIWLAKVQRMIDENLVDGAVLLVGRATKALGFIAAWIDKHIVDGLVNLVGLTTHAFGSAVRQLQTGRIQQYVSFAVAGGLLAAAFLILL
jgi:NADH-quinone oxidoreductase subunit L